MREKGELAALINTGSTCYINCILQCYFSIPALRQMVHVLDVEALEPTPTFDMGKIKALAELQQLFAKMECSARGYGT